MRHITMKPGDRVRCLSHPVYKLIGRTGVIKEIFHASEAYPFMVEIFGSEGSFEVFAESEIEPLHATTFRLLKQYYENR